MGKLERGLYRWPSKQYREALRHVLGASAGADLCFYVTRRPAAPLQEQPDVDRAVTDGRSPAETPPAWAVAAGFSINRDRLDDAFEANDDEVLAKAPDTADYFEKYN